MSFLGGLVDGIKKVGAVGSFGLAPALWASAGQSAGILPTNQGGADGLNYQPHQFNEAADAPEVRQFRNAVDTMRSPQIVSVDQTFNPDTSKYQGSVYQAQNFSGPLEEFNSMRQQTNQQFNQQQSANQDAIARRFAAMGNINSGAYAKSAQNADLSMNQQREQSLNNIGFQEAQQRRQLQREEQNKVFQSQEANKGREFQFGQNQAQRNFTGQESASQRKLQAQEFNVGQNNDFNKFKVQSQAQIAQLDAQARQFQQQIAEDRYQAELNRYTQEHSGGLLGSGGFLGTGL